MTTLRCPICRRDYDLRELVNVQHQAEDEGLGLVQADCPACGDTLYSELATCTELELVRRSGRWWLAWAADLAQVAPTEPPPRLRATG